MLAFFLLTLFLADAGSAAFSPVVKTKTGPVRGKLVEIAGAGQSVYEFTGIPFAEPPIGERRFKKPVPKAPWTQILDAVNPSTACMPVGGPSNGSSTDAMFGPAMAVPGIPSEDCLYLNVWVPKRTLDSLSSNGATKMLSTFVFIYGGGFTSGSSSIGMYNGAVLSGFDNIIVASMQYRLGSFGFAYYGPKNNSDAPGNVGLWDQTEALKWISENIAVFGGNSSQITLGGESAGAVAVTLHLLSPYSRKYFQRGIVESGSAITFWPPNTRETAQGITDMLLNATKCSDSADKLKCLRSVDAVTLAVADAAVMAMSFPKKPNAVIDGDFLPRDPHEMLAAGDFYKAPLIIGANSEEGGMTLLSVPEAMAFLPSPYNPSATFDSLNLTHYTKLLKLALPEDLTKNLDDDLFKLIQLQYWPTGPANQGFPKGASVLQAAIQASSDYAGVCPTYNWARTAAKFLQSGADKVPMYVYQFKQHPNSEVLAKVLPTWVGAWHGVELSYVFGLAFMPGAETFRLSYDDQVFTKIIMEYWGNFVKYGDPNVRDEYARRHFRSARPIGRSSLRYWPPLIGNQSNCPDQIVALSVKSQVYQYGEQVNCGLKVRECMFWGNVFPKLQERVAKAKKN